MCGSIAIRIICILKQLNTKKYAYYPKSQIKTNLYTNGGEYILSNNCNNIQDIFMKLSNGDKFTGKPS
jgi:hypothetical protein